MSDRYQAKGAQGAWQPGSNERPLADVMAVQADREPLDYSSWDADKLAYFGAIRQGLAGNCGPMKRLAAEALRR